MGSTKYRPGTTYDAAHKIWSGEAVKDYYAQDLSIGEIMYEEMRRHPRHVCQISDTEHTILTKEEMLRNAVRVASYLRAACVSQKDIIGIIARNTTHIAAVAYACFFNGTAFHSVNPSYDEETIRELYAITKPKIIFCDGCDYVKVKNGLKDLKVKIYTMKDPVAGVPDILDILKLPIDEDFRPAKLENGIGQTLAILCSSGTTGTPKAVTLSNARKLFYYSNFLNSSDIQFSTSTFDWITGLLTLITTAVYGTKRIIVDEPYNPLKYLQIIEEYKVTWTFQAPAHMGLLLNCKSLCPDKLDSLRYYLYGGGRCTLQAQQQLQSQLRNGQVHFVYGFTEVGALMTQNNHFSEKPNSVGRLIPGFHVKIISDAGKPLGPDELGEIYVQHGQHWSGYFGNEPETKKMRDADGWFHSGDLGYFDEDCFLYVVERKKDMLKYMGIMYYPNEVESVIAQMPEVAEVCVFGVWNQLEGDAAAAAVVKKPGMQLRAQDVIDYVSMHMAANYKHLHAGAIVVEELKRNANGKINRNANKAHFLDVRDDN